MMKKLLGEGYTNIVTRTHQELDLTRQKDVEDFFLAEQPEYVFHLAAKTGGVMQNKLNLVEHLSEGMQISLNVLDAAGKFAVKGLVYTSSVLVYSEDAKQPLSEDAPLTRDFSGVYFGYILSKIFGMEFCKSVYKQDKRKFIAAILPTVYGLNNYGTTVVPMLADKFSEAVISNTPSVEIWGTGDVLREFIHAEDVADALLFLMEHGVGGQFYNIGSGEEYSIRQLAGILQEVSGFKGELLFDSTKPESSKRRFLDSKKILELGWSPKNRFINRIDEVYREHMNRKMLGNLDMLTKA